MKIVKKRSDLPENILQKLVFANVFYTSNYEIYIRNNNADALYIYNEKLILLIVVYTKIGIKYAACPSECELLEENVENNEVIAFLNGVIDELKRNRIAWILSSATAFFQEYPDNSFRIPFGSHVIDLTLDEEQILSNMHSKHRNVIKRAEKCGVIVKNGSLELLEDYVLMDKITWARSGKNSYGNEYFKNMFESLKSNIVIYIAYMKGIPQAGACYYFNEKMCYYMFGVSIDKPETGATNYLHWCALCDMKKRNVKEYSFVGCRINEDKNSKYHTIQRFKERFGGKLRSGFMFKSIIIPWKYNLFCTIYKLKNKKPFTDAVEEEISKWPELQKDFR